LTRMCIILAEGFADWECAHMMAAGRAHMGIEMVVATPDGQNVVSMGGLKVMPDLALEAVCPDDFDAVVFCGGTVWRGNGAPEIGPVASVFAQHGKLVAAICDGVLGLARTGLLDTRAHTGDAPDIPGAAPNYKGQAHYRETPGAVRDGTIITAGGLAPVQFMVAVLSALGHGGPELDAYAKMLGAEHQSITPAG
jgi:putative intracellular protease/amidase